MKPFAAAAEQNREVILAAIEPLLRDKKQVLEIGSGTGQHAVHFAKAMPWLEWQCSELEDKLAGIQLWLDEAGLGNIAEPVALDVTKGPWPTSSFDAVYSCNTAHILAMTEVEAMFRGVADSLTRGGIFMLYGPFNYGGEYTSESNRQFDAWLKRDNPLSGIRDKSELDQLASEGHMMALHDIAMPSNNRILVWQKTLETT